MHSFHDCSYSIKRRRIISHFIRFTLLQLLLWGGALPCLAQDEGAEEGHSKAGEHEPGGAHGHPLTVGVAVPYSFHLGVPGANLRMYYNQNEHICFGPEYAWFRKGDIEVVDFDLVIHYVFHTKWLGLYPLLGANYTIEMETAHGERETVARPGVLFGAGVHRVFRNFTLLVEYSRVELGVVDDFVTLGLMYTFK